MTLEGSGATLIGLRLRLGPGGGFTLEGSNGVEARPATDGWTIHGSSFDGGTRLVPASDGNGLRLVDAAGTDLGSCCSLTGGLIGEDPPSVTLVDGRVFRVASTGHGFAVHGWEGRGAYLEVVPDDAGWRILVTAAGQNMDELSRLILLTTAAIARDGSATGS